MCCSDSVDVGRPATSPAHSLESDSELVRCIADSIRMGHVGGRG